MKLTFGLAPQLTSDIKTILTQNLCAKRSYSISVFGSRAMAKYRQYSDLDLWVEADPALKPEEIANLNTLFENSDLPIEIDLLTPETCLEAYRDRILSEKKPWFTGASI